MKGKMMLTIPAITALLAFVGGLAISAQDKYTEKVPNGLAFSEFRGYEAWQLVSISQDGALIASILANPVMIKAYQSGVPGNGKPFPDGSKMAKVHWNPKKMETFPAATVPGTQHDVDFMVKDSKRFADSGGWGYGVFDYDAASDTFTPRHYGQHAAAGERCEVRVRMPHHVVEDKRLCVHRLRAQVKRIEQHSCKRRNALVVPKFRFDIGHSRAASSSRSRSRRCRATPRTSRWRIREPRPR